MRCHLYLPACLLLWTVTGFVSCDEAKTKEITVEELSDGIKLSCSGNITSGNVNHGKILSLAYKDENSGLYRCTGSGETEESEGSEIFVKFRTCDNCIELDMTAFVGMAVGDVVATIVIAVAVYLFAAAIPTSPVASSNKRPERQRPAVQEARGASSDPYQRLRFKSPKDTYDELTGRR